MNDIKHLKVGDEVVRSKGDYVVGRTGKIIAINKDKNRAQVDWFGNSKTWVSLDSIEPTSIPYAIVPIEYNEFGRRISWPKYILKSEGGNK